MGLICWLPLMGTLENKGISNITVINNGATVDTNGKIGSCYSFNGNNYYISLVGQQLFDCFKGENQQFSICMWVYHADSRRAVLFGDWSLSNSIGFNIELSTGHGVRFYWNGSPDYSPGINVGSSIWNHITFTYDGTALRSYLNGNLIATRSGALAARSKTAGEFRLGRDNRTTETALNGKLNDVRIYKDHALSAAEVREISQGLVLHYKLDGFMSGSGENLFTNTNRWYTATSSSFANTSGYLPLNFTKDLQQLVGKTICFSFELYTPGTRTNGSGNLGNRFGAHLSLNYTPSGGSATQVYPCASHLTDTIAEQHYRVFSTYTVPSNCTINSFGMSVQPLAKPGDNNTATWSIGQFKVEFGNKPTSYSPAPIDLGIDITKIEDSSGYNHNGTVTGNITLNTNTPRYSISSSFNGTERITTTTPGADIRTLSCWCKTTKDKSTSQHMVADSFSNMCISFYKGTIIGVFGTTRSTGSKSTLGDSYKENDWNHIVVVKTDDAGARDIYCNGVKLTPTSNDYWSPATGFFVGARNTSNGNPFYGEINDVRAYVTALDADAIRQLYEVGTKVDNKGNLHTYEFLEQEGFKIHKTGVTTHKKFIEPVLLNSGPTVSYKPAANTNNSCATGVIVDFSEFAESGLPITVIAEYDINWSNLAVGTGGSLAATVQGNNRQIADNTWVWSGSNYVTSSTIPLSGATGTTHIRKVSTIPASWLNTYNASHLGIRCNYSDGNGTLSLTNIKVTIDQNKCKIKKEYIQADEFIEL